VAVLNELSFQLLFEMASDAIFVADAATGRILDANRKACAMLDRTIDEIRTLHFSDLHPPAERERLSARFRQDNSLDEPDGELVVCGLQRRDGFVYTCELGSRRIEQHGRLLALGIFRDITERIRALEDIHLRNVAIASFSSGVSIADARLPDLPLIYVNRGFEELTGYSAREAIGRSCRFLQGPASDQPELDTLRHALRTGGSCVVRLKNFRKDGSLFFNELHLSPVHNEAGELTHYVGIQIDVTERVRNREALAAAYAREKELNEIKTRFINTVSHEFRTPITTIQGSCHILRDYSHALPKERIARHFDNIEAALRRMTRLLNSVLLVARGEAGRLPFNPVQLDVHQFCESLVESLDIAIREPNRIVRRVNLPTDSRYWIDESLLHHVLQNLLSNALKYSPVNQCVDLEVSPTADGLRFAVTDHGIGIPSAEQTQLFDSFFRASNVGHVGGTGLGLYIARRAAELHGGSLSFHSEPGRGTRFELTIPCRTPATPPIAAPAVG
jgi:PAS domain S-box-containing protein